MKRLPLLILALWFAFPASMALAAPARIAVVDMVDLIEAHPRATDLQRQLEQRQTEAKTYAMGEQTSLRELQAQIEFMNRNNPMRRVREKELITQKAMVELELKWLEQEAMREYMDGLEALYSQIQMLVARYARQNGIGVVFLKTAAEIKAVDFNDYGAKIRLRAVVYHEESLDITEKIKAGFARPAAPAQPAQPVQPAQPTQPAQPGR